MNKWLPLLAFAVLLAVPLVHAKPIVTLRAGLGVDNPEPYSYAPDSPQANIYRAVLEQISKQSGIRFEVEYYPSQRIQQLFELAKLDVEVGVNPAWRVLSPVSGFYTEPIGNIEYMLCFRTGKWHRGAHPDELRGLTIGTLSGQRFPSLDAAFTSGAIKRDVSANQGELLNRLRLGKTDAVIMDRHQVMYLQQQTGPHRCEPGETVGSTPVMLRLHPQYRQLLPVLNKAIQQLNAEGKLRLIYQQSR